MHILSAVNNNVDLQVQECFLHLILMTEVVSGSCLTFRYSYHQGYSCQWWGPQWQVSSFPAVVLDSWVSSTGVVVKEEDNTLKKFKQINE